MVNKKELLVIAVLVGIFLIISMVSAGQMMALQGNVKNSTGSYLTTGNLTVGIWDSLTGGNLIYNSTDSYEGNITNGKYDVMLGEYNTLNLNYGQNYYMGIEINSEALSFNNESRRIFQPSVGIINSSFLNLTTLDLSMINSTGNITTTNWYNGLFNWFIDTVSVDYLSFNGTTLSFNETTLNLTIDNRLVLGNPAIFSTLNVTGISNFGGGWEDGGSTINGGNIFTQALYVVNISSVSVSNLAINGTISPGGIAVFNNTFDLGIPGTNEWRYGYFGTDILIGGESVKKWMYNMSDGSYNASYAALVTDNSTWSEARADTLYSDIKWGYNQTYSGSTYNETYDALVSGNVTFNQTLTDGLYVPYEGATANVNLGENTLSSNFGNKFGNLSNNYITFNEWDLSGAGHGKYVSIKTVSNDAVGNFTTIDNGIIIKGNQDYSDALGINDSTLMFMDVQELSSSRISYNDASGIMGFYDADYFNFDSQIYVNNGNIAVDSSHDVCISGGNCLSTVGGVDGTGGWTNTSTQTFTSLDINGSGKLMVGNGVVAPGAYSIAMGGSTNASSAYSTAIGYDTKASGQVSTAMGDSTTASGYASTALGEQTTASEQASTAIGYGTIASGFASTAMGQNTNASGQYSTAIGSYTKASGQESTAMGYKTIASGSTSTAIGYETTASGDYSTAIGRSTTASGFASFAFGENTNASGYASTAMGRNINVSGFSSFAIALTDMGGVDVSRDNTMAIMGGNVGIGTVSPGYTLEVNGNVSADYFIGDGSLLTGISGSTYNATYDAITGGNASWNESLANELYADIKWGYNQTYSGSTYNATYASLVTDNSTWSEARADTLYTRMNIENNGDFLINSSNGAIFNVTDFGEDGAIYSRIMIDSVSGDNEAYLIIEGMNDKSTWLSLKNYGGYEIGGDGDEFAGFKLQEEDNSTQIEAYRNIILFPDIDGGNPDYNYVKVNGNLSVSGNVSADYYKGDGSLLTGIIEDNSTFNQILTDGLYADIKWGYNMSDGSYNSTYDIWSYNQTEDANTYTDEIVTANNASWSSTYNATYDAITGGNASWNESYATTLYSDIEWGYNQTTATYNLYNDDWSSTYNATYDAYTNDGTGGWTYTGMQTIAYVDILGYGRLTLGEESNAYGKNSIAAGYYSKAIGNYSIATGYQSETSGEYSVAMGVGTNASGFSSVAMGSDTLSSGGSSFAMGHDAIASGDNSIAMGYKTNASGDYSVAMGRYTIVSGLNGFAVGFDTKASGTSSVAMGEYTLASGHASMSIGSGSISSGRSSVAMGEGTIASGSYSLAAGKQTNASGAYSVAMGYNTNASGVGSYTLGVFTIASGEYSVATGWSTNASGAYSVAMGHNAKASGGYSVSMGRDIIASGESSMAMGAYSIASSDFSVAMGHNTTASGEASFAVGEDTISAGVGSFAAGINTTASGNDGGVSGAFAIGYNTRALDAYSVAMGDRTTASGLASVAMGSQVDVSGQASVGFGSDISVTNDNTVGIGGYLQMFPRAELTCSSTTEGMIYYNTVANKHYACNSTDWNALY